VGRPSPILHLWSLTKLRTITETVYSDGSGVAGTYEVYGARYSGIRTPETITVTPLGIPTWHQSARAKGVRRSACAQIERHLAAIQLPPAAYEDLCAP
jgi:hypothetical protein